MKSLSDNSTKPSSNINDNAVTEEPVPSFLKALTCYQTDDPLLQIEDSENEQQAPDILNETFSKSSGNIEVIQ